jgi:hypothetical protein
VDPKEIEKIALPEMDSATSTTSVFLIDEIGKMECFSKPFVQAAEKLLNDPKPLVIGTIAEKGSGFIQQVKQRPDVKILYLCQSTFTGNGLKTNYRTESKYYAKATARYDKTIETLLNDLLLYTIDTERLKE